MTAWLKGFRYLLSPLIDIFYLGDFDIVFMGCLNDEPHAIWEILCEIAA